MFSELAQGNSCGVFWGFVRLFSKGVGPENCEAKYTGGAPSATLSAKGSRFVVVN